MNSLGNLLDFTSNVAKSSSAENVEETIKLVVESAGIYLSIGGGIQIYWCTLA